MADTLGSIKRYVSVGECIQTNAQLLNVNAANLHRFPGVPGCSGCGNHVSSTRPALSPWRSALTPFRRGGRGLDIRTGNGWVRVILLGFCGPPQTEPPRAGLHVVTVQFIVGHWRLAEFCF